MADVSAREETDQGDAGPTAENGMRGLLDRHFMEAVRGEAVVRSHSRCLARANVAAIRVVGAATVACLLAATWAWRALAPARPWPGHAPLDEARAWLAVSAIAVAWAALALAAASWALATAVNARREIRAAGAALPMAEKATAEAEMEDGGQGAPA